MILLDTKKRSFKILNIAALYAIILQISIPSVSAMSSFMNPEQKVFSHLFSGSNNLPIANTSQREEKQIEMPEIPKESSVTRTTGSGQSESGGFSIGSSDGLVNKFTGDFSYSIPLGDVEGYPLTLQYNANVSMNTDASWVGLGMSFNVGDVTREMRGLPDEFNGEQTINRTFNQLEETTIGGKAGGFIGKGAMIKGTYFAIGGEVTMLLGGYKNSYIGVGRTFDLSLNAKINMFSNDLDLGVLSPAFGYSSDSKRGIGTNKSIGLSTTENFALGASGTFGTSFHSRAGLTNLFYSVDVNGSGKKFGVSAGMSNSIPYGTRTSVPSVKLNSYGRSFSSSFNLYKGLSKELYKVNRYGLIISGYSNSNSIEVNASSQIVQPALGYFHNGKRQAFENDITNVIKPLMDFNRSNDFEFSGEMAHLAFSFQTFDLFTASAMGIGETFRGRRNDVGTYYDPTNTSENLGDGVDLSIGTTESRPKLTTSNSINMSIPYSIGEVTSGNIKNGSENFLEFSPEAKGNNFDNTVYFKSLAEMTPESVNDLSLLGGSGKSYLKIEAADNNKNVNLKNELINSGGITSVINNSLISTSNPIYQASYFKPYTAVEYSSFEQFYSSLTEFGPAMHTTGVITINRLSGLSPNMIGAQNHLSAIETVTTDGMKYTFGIPAYELTSSQVSFCADGLVSNSNGIVEYSKGILNPTTLLYENADNSIQNKKGISNYFDKTEVPAYAHSFLLTKMVSSDYVDRGIPGFSADDIGSAFKFNHIRVYGGNNPFKWKFPMGENLAMFSQANLGTTQDDMANYSYGEKEVWYPHSVESKNLIAEFITSDREDGFGVMDENGKIDDSKPLKKLDKIVIYNRSERLGPNGATAIPLQTVEFEYTYELCQNLPSNKNTAIPINPNVTAPNSGKLTLKKIRSYAGNSKEMGVYAYEFTYDQTKNKNFSYQNADEWGNFKIPNNKPTELYPYADQNTNPNTNISNADENSKAWKLIKIQNPMHGTIEVEYESDTYATVQDNRAMKHLDVYGMTNLIDFFKAQSLPFWDASLVYDRFSKDFGSENNLQNTLNSWTNASFSNFRDKLLTKSAGQCESYRCDFGTIDLNMFPNNVIVFRLDKSIPFVNSSSQSITPEMASNEVRDQYFTNQFANGGKELMTELYLKLFVNVKDDVKELVPMFANIMENQTDVFGNTIPVSDDFTSIGVMPPTPGVGYEFGYVVIEPAQAKEKENKEGKDSGDSGKRHAIQINSLQKAATEYIRRNLPDIVYGSCPSCDGNTNLDASVLVGTDINVAMYKKDWALSFVSGKTTLRVFVANSIKYGGNSRVKSITYSDGWNAISGEFVSSYKWNYTYGNKNTTSGNAAFEPRQGIDECPLYKWDTYTNFAKRYPDEAKFTPTPIAIDLYPAPIIGYASVTVDFNSLTTKGKSVSMYYTTRDFPTIEVSTEIQKLHVDKGGKKLLGISNDVYGFSEGFVVKTNDFHGKPKEMFLYTKDPLNTDLLQSRTEYHYATLGDPIEMIDREGIISKEIVGQEIDIHADSRNLHSIFISKSFGITFSVITLNASPSIDAIPATAGSPSIPAVPAVPAPPPAVPYLLVMPSFSYTKRNEEFKSHALIKHINQSAIVTSIETEYLGSINTAKNILYDKYTGNVILSSLKDEYEDELFSLSYPSHWYYEELREKSGTDHTIVTATISATGELTDLNIDEQLTPGDAVRLLNVNTQPLVYVAKKSPWPTNGTLYLITNAGFSAATTYTITPGSHQIQIIRTNRDNRLNETMQSVVTKKNPIYVTNGFAVINFPNSQSVVAGPVCEVIEAGAISYKDKNNYKCITEKTDRPFNEVQVGQKMNPYLYGVRGDLVMEYQYSWQSERNNASHAFKTRFDGTYSSYIPLYSLNPLYPGKWYKINEPNHPNYVAATPFQKWKKSGEVTTYNQFGNPIENIDQIKVPSSVLYGYNNGLELVPIAQAVNARQQEIAYDGFEDYTYFSNESVITSESHFDFRSAVNSTSVTVVNSTRHSGLSSLQVAAGSSASVTKKVSSACLNTTVTDVSSNSYIVEECRCIKPFEPTRGEYIVGAWVRNDNPLNASIGKIVVTFTNNNVSLNTVEFFATGPIIDGWQRLEGEFSIPSTATGITISLQNTSSTNVYFDDIRIHPLLAGMTTVVYDPKTLLPLATHDGYNFTTFYNYDENLNQVRVRVETVEGIKTISETESGGFKSPKPY